MIGDLCFNKSSTLFMECGKLYLIRRLANSWCTLIVYIYYIDHVDQAVSFASRQVVYCVKKYHIILVPAILEYVILLVM